MNRDTPFGEATITAPCKVNLRLKITGRRADGLHELDTVFHPLDEPADTLRLSPLPDGAGIRLVCDVNLGPPDDNLVVRAYEAFARATGFAPPIRVELEKRIPAGAGLGGGSSDAAALLAHLNRHARERALAAKELAGLALGLGADVPFFLLGRPARARGIGELLDPLSTDLPGVALLLACPEIHVSTAWAYGAWDERNHLAKGVRKSLLTGHSEKSTCPFCLEPEVWENDFEEVVFAAHPELRRLKERLYRLGAAAAVMSGSGSSLVAAFRDTEAAERAAHGLDETGVRAYLPRPDAGV